MSSGFKHEDHCGISRLNWESDHEWHCRTIFIDVNKQYFTGDRLAAYSMAWANWKFMGNRYAQQMQQLLETCDERLPQDIDDRIKALDDAKRQKIKFVRSSSGCGGDVSFIKSSSSSSSKCNGDDDVEVTFIKSSNAKRNGGVSFVKSSTSHCNEEEEEPMAPDEGSNEEKCFGSSSSLLSSFVGSGPSAYSTKQNNHHNNNNSNSTTTSTLTSNGFDTPKMKKNQLIPGLTIYSPAHNQLGNPIGTVNESCQKSGIPLDFVDKHRHSTGGFLCTLTIAGVHVADGLGESKKMAKYRAAENGLKILLQKQGVINKAELNHNGLKVIEKGTLVRQSYENASKLGEDNKGNKLLRKMGWKGSGGIGKHESGRAEPVFLDAVEGRKGVGTEVNKVIKRKTVEEKLVEFIGTDQLEIRFSNELGNEERALIHRLSQKFGLKHKSYGKGDERYLVVSKKS